MNQRIEGSLIIVVNLLSLSVNVTPDLSLQFSSILSDKSSTVFSFSIICSINTQVSPMSFRFRLRAVAKSIMVFFFKGLRETCCPSITFIFANLSGGTSGFLPLFIDLEAIE